MSTIIFPSSPFNGQLYPEQPTPGIAQYQYNAQADTWELVDGPCICEPANNIILDNISGLFNGTDTTFPLTSVGSPYVPPNAVQMIVTVGNIMQEAMIDYTVAGATITFTTAPAAGLDCILLVNGGGQAAPANNLLLDDIDSLFNGSLKTFSLTYQGEPYVPANEEQLVVNLGGIQQKPNEHYTVAGSTITFSTAPAGGLNCFIIALYGGGFGANAATGGGGVSRIIAGTYISVDPEGGTGAVTVNNTYEPPFYTDGSNIWSCTTNFEFNPIPGSYNFMVGWYSGYNLNFGGDDNTFIGNYSGYSETGCSNTFIGMYAGRGPENPPWLSSITVNSCTCIISPNRACYYVELPTANQATLQLWLCRPAYTGQLRSTGYVRSKDNSITPGQTVTIPGACIGGTTPADNATITLNACTSSLTDTWWTVAIGHCAAANNYGYDTYGGVFIGAYAGADAGLGDRNPIYIGNGAGAHAFGGLNNIHIGSYAGCCAGGPKGFANTFIGAFAGKKAANNYNQTFVGAYAGCSVRNLSHWGGNTNQLFGAWAGENLTTGLGNSFFGLYTGCRATTGSYNATFGHASGSNNSTGSFNAVFGAYAGSAGFVSGWPYTSGCGNAFFGANSGNLLAFDAGCNTFLGYRTGAGNICGIFAWSCSGGTALPGQANCSYYVCPSQFIKCPSNLPTPLHTGVVKVTRNPSGSVCSVEVIDPGENMNQYIWCAIPGSIIGGSSPADDLQISVTAPTSAPPANGACQIRNVFAGSYSGALAICSNSSTFVGFRAGFCSYCTNDNVFLGAYSGFRGLGSNNIFVGKNTGYSSTGGGNVFVGSQAGCTNGTGANNIAIGQNSGTDAVFTLGSSSNQIVLGNNSHTNAYIKVNWTVTSDERDKTCISEIRHGLDFVTGINPIQFNWKDRETGEVTDEAPRYGFIAQEILAAEGDPAILVDDNDPENLKLRESMMTPVLVKAIQELCQKVETLEARIQTLENPSI
jgi:hypothetical protein